MRWLTAVWTEVLAEVVAAETPDGGCGAATSSALTVGPAGARAGAAGATGAGAGDAAAAAGAEAAAGSGAAEAAPQHSSQTPQTGHPGVVQQNMDPATAPPQTLHE